MITQRRLLSCSRDAREVDGSTAMGIVGLGKA
jgi:hypothetical protein